jgi:hypothetical protein
MSPAGAGGSPVTGVLTAFSVQHSAVSWEDFAGLPVVQTLIAES